MAPLSPYRYQQIARNIRDCIEKGLLQAGDRLPSIRDQASRQEVSLNTVKEAYAQLEREGLVRARPQSGFVVAPMPVPDTAVSRHDAASLDFTKVSMCRIYWEFKLQDRPGSVNLGVALTDLGRHLLPRLQGYLADAALCEPGDMLGYAISPGHEPLRSEIARHASRQGFVLNPEEILVTSGCTEAMHLALGVLCRPGDTVAVESPCYFNLLQLLDCLGLRILEIPCDQKGMSPGALEFALDHNQVKALILTPHFSNPCGYLMDQERKAELYGLCSRRDIPLVEDDIYGELHFDAQRPLPIKNLDTQGRVIYCTSFSKTVAPGLRVGWMACGRWFKELDRFKTLTSIATGTPYQMVLARLMQDGEYDRHLRFLRRQLGPRVAAMRQAVLDSFVPGTQVREVRGGLVLWVELPQSMDAAPLYSRALEQDILFAPGVVFSTSGKFRNCLRINAGIWDQRMEEGVRTLGRLSHESGPAS